MFLFDSKRGDGACPRRVTAYDGAATEMAAASASPFASIDKIRQQEEFAPLSTGAARAHPRSPREQTTFDHGLASGLQD
jgi:hypothetical protein